MKNHLSWLTASIILCVILSCCNLTYAEQSGTDGNIHWEMNRDHVLTISGKGNMNDYFLILIDDHESKYITSAPWGTEVTNVIVEEGVTTIGDGAFTGCSNLKSVTLPESLISIGDQAFQGCSYLESISLPDGLTRIGIAAFDGCLSLKTLTIPDSVPSIERYTFNNCDNLETVIIPDGLTSIGKNAFWSCDSLKSLYLPAGIKIIGAEAFAGTPNLILSVASENKNFTVEDGILFTKDKKGLLYFPPARTGEYTIPSDVVYIGKSAFLETLLTSITIPDSVTLIDSSALAGSDSLTDITVPASVTIMGDYVFGGSGNLTIHGAPNSVVQEKAQASGITFVASEPTVQGSIISGEFSADQEEGEDPEDHGISAEAVLSTPSSSNEYLATIQDDGNNLAAENETGAPATQSNDTNASHIENVTTSMDVASNNDDQTNHTDVVASEVEDIKDFRYSIEQDGTVCIIEYIGTKSQVIIPAEITGQTVTAIGKLAFYGNYVISEITVPENIKSIGSGAFSYCTNLQRGAHNFLG